MVDFVNFIVLEVDTCIGFDLMLNDYLYYTSDGSDLISSSGSTGICY
jgi:hypothetical protein